MKKEFIGFYNPTEKEIDDAWNKGTFAFDANSLLNLYRYSELTRKDFISALKTIKTKTKLFLPFQAAYEFHSNRIKVIDGIESTYTTINELLEDNFSKVILPQLNQFKKHPSIIIQKIIKLYEDFRTKVNSELNAQNKNHPDFKTEDSILTELTELFESAVGAEFSKEEHQKIYIEGKERYSESIPPGFRDLENKKKKGEKHIYGDLIIWKELIKYTANDKKPIIFITDDRKEDWWTIENGKTIRPREELIKEFFDITGVRILIYNADNFLHFAKEKKLVPLLKDKTIEEVKEIRVSDEKYYANYNDLINQITPNSLSALDYALRPSNINQLISSGALSQPATVSALLSASALAQPRTTNDFILNALKNTPMPSELLNTNALMQASIPNEIIRLNSQDQSIYRIKSSNISEASSKEINANLAHLKGTKINSNKEKVSDKNTGKK